LKEKEKKVNIIEIRKLSGKNQEPDKRIAMRTKVRREKRKAELRGPMHARTNILK